MGHARLSVLRDAQDLLEVLVGYFRQGLADNEFCMWVTSEPLGVEEARSALRRVVPDLDDRIRRGQIEFLDYREWYSAGGRFDAERVLQGWAKKEREALARGYEGVRLTGNASWLDKANWEAFFDCEAVVNTVIGTHRMLALCTYSFDQCRGVEMFDVLRNHPLALVRKGGRWEVIQSPLQRKTEESLRQSERRQRAILDTIPDPAWLKDKEGRFLAVNAAWCQFLGLDAGEVLGKTGFDFLPREVAVKFEEQDRTIMQSGHPLQHEELLRGKDAQMVWFEAIVSPLYDDHGEVVGTTGLARDITERKQAEEALRASEERFRVTFDKAPVGMVIGVGDGIIAQANRALCCILGYSQEELVGRHVRDFVYPEDQELSGPFVKRLLAGEIPSFTLEKRYLRKERPTVLGSGDDRSGTRPKGRGHICLGYCGGYHRPQAGRARASAGQARCRSRQPCQKRVPRQYESRASYPHDGCSGIFRYIAHAPSYLKANNVTLWRRFRKTGKHCWD